jgi:anaerobic selenocysteine-containing dehydrogenase
VFSIDDRRRIVKVRGDRDNPVTKGYACIRGLSLHEAHYSKDRIVRPLRRRQDGSFEPIALSTALDEIAARLEKIIQRHGRHSVAVFRGTMNGANGAAVAMIDAWMKAIGSRSIFSTMTIDQSAKWVAAERLGVWAGGRDPYATADVLLFLGTNPLVAATTQNFYPQNPVKSIRAAKERGVKIIVIDPRRTETAKLADVFLQIKPGEDATLLAGLTRLILENGWQDEAFCARFAEGVEALRQAVSPFTESYVAHRIGVTAADLLLAARLFAEPFPDRPKRGSAASGTGPNMARHSNLNEHLLEALNVICGRYARVGDRVPNPGVVGARKPRRAEVVPPRRSWESGWHDPDGYGIIFGERMTATLPSAMLSDGDGAVRALIIDGGNPVNAIPGNARSSRAFQALDLLVCIEPFLNETSKLAHFILPPPMMLERHDVFNRDYESFMLFLPYTQYCKPVIPVPEHSELIEDWRVFWELAKRLSLELRFDGVDLDMTTIPTIEELIAILVRNSGVPFEEIRKATAGRTFDVPPMFVEEGDGDGRFALCPGDVAAELAQVRREPLPEGRFRFACRRIRYVNNTMYHRIPSIAARWPGNPAWMNPYDLEDLGLVEGDLVRITSVHGNLEVPVAADPELRPGMISMTHGWGDGVGVNVNALTSSEMELDPINAMPVMTGFDVTVVPVREVAEL